MSISTQELTSPLNRIIRYPLVFFNRISCPDVGGGRRDRTDDLMLAKHALSQLSYAPISQHASKTWWAWVDLNYRPHAYQACALTS